MPFTPRPRFDWRLRTRTLPLGERTLLMGILNITPDSFSDGGHFAAPHDAIDHALVLLDSGADLIDLGGESTNPRSRPITPEEEWTRVRPVLEAILRARPEAILSIDTFHASTARRAIEAGAEIVNDVSGFTWNPEMACACAEMACGVVLMHTYGRPQEWATQPRLEHREILPLVTTGLASSLAAAHSAGIVPERIVLDPGFGFGKIGAENLTLHAQLDQLHALGHPLLVGTSRKGFLGQALVPLHHGKAPAPDDRLCATLASNVAAILAGAHILRVHDLRPAAEAAAVADGILAAG
ncbi:MAG TPA: dihydropteroate synthase [Granulicella sp.]